MEVDYESEVGIKREASREDVGDKSVPGATV